MPGRFRYTVLYVYGGHVRIGSLLEIDRDRGGTGVGSRGGHVGHIFHAVDRLFQRGYDTLLHGLGIRPEVSRTDHNGRRGDIRILFYGQGEKPDDTRNHNRDGNYGGQYGAFYKCANFHCS